MACSTSLAKMILFVFNIVFFLFGIASLGVGIWVVANRGELFRFINLVDGKVAEGSNRADIDAVANQHGLVEIAGFVLIGLGVFTLLVGFCGCCGAMKESKCLLMIYAILVSLVLAVEVAAAVLAAVFQSRIRSQAVRGMKKLQDEFFISVNEYVRDRQTGKSSVTYLLNYVQVAFSCCGAAAVGDVANSSSWLASNRTWEGRELTVPLTCCRVKDRNAVLNPSFDWSKFTSLLEDSECPYAANGTGMHAKTCDAGLMEFVGRYAGPLIGVCVGIALFELFCVVVACCLFRAIEPKD